MHATAEQFQGYALEEREQNLSNDSYFHLTYWNPDTAKPESVEYAATAYPSNPMQPATVQALLAATLPAVRSAYAKWNTDMDRVCAARSLAYVLEQRMWFKYPEAFKGATVTVARGRKVRKGLTGKVLSHSRRTFGFNTKTDYFFIDCGTDGCHTVAADNVEVLQHAPEKLQELFDLSN